VLGVTAANTTPFAAEKHTSTQPTGCKNNPTEEKKCVRARRPLSLFLAKKFLSFLHQQ
jgi:hypothetical protein